MASLPARPQYICQSCIKYIVQCTRFPKLRAVHAQRRYNSTDSPDEPSFRIAKHYKKLSKSEEAIGEEHGLSKASVRPTWESGLKVNLDDGQYVARSGKRIPYSTPRNHFPLHNVPLPDPPPVHVPVEARRTMTRGKRPQVTVSTKTPSFIHGRQASRKVEEAEFEFLKPSEPSEAPPPVKIWSPEKPMSHASLHFGALQDWNWYWETMPPTMTQRTQAQHFFTKNASPKFLQSVAFFRAFPDSNVPEIAFVGRSNVGKSSLLNAIVNADTKALLARTSSTPGFTKTMNLYGLGPQGGVHFKKQPSGHGKIVGTGGITIVDMPGYGEGSLSEWGQEIMKYLQGRKQLRRVFVLIDAQHGVKDKDRSLLASLRLGGISHQVILSKVDKIYLPQAKTIKRFDGKRLDKLKPKGTMEGLRKTMEKLREEIQPPNGAGAIGEILACSSEVLVDERRLGIDAVRFAMLQAMGFQFRTDQSAVERAKKEGPTIRTIKTHKVMDQAVERPVTRTVAPAQLASTKISAREQRAARRAGRKPSAGSQTELLERLSGSVG
ncbi:uncharacterized protein N0V89_001216 [Didymosphaeria variabile]|uniref:EngB-type G domain-containing protein n=1 Tax=Didymosphaeria variabile TaxID=1932322 RepID=A0A9W9CGJ4_9PLEO|nr:uncharacterized protein N0V89_001216 [Didymosphaeria variabile]KAJ4360650.1 hypothetical protein N0V89_001216 [Didymosphaeria variabile]